MRARCGDFDIDAERYQLRRVGAVQPVEPLVFDLLLHFDRNPGRVLSRDDLVAAVWDGRAVSDATISSALKSARRALVHALAATRLDPQNAYARCWLGIVHFFRGENDKFEAETQIALQLNPNDPETLADIGHYLAFMGEFDRGVELSRHARRLNPLHPGWYYFATACWHYDRREYAAVITETQRSGLSAFYWAHMLAAAAQGQLGLPDAAASLGHVFKLKPGFDARAELKKWNAAPHDLEHLLEGLRKAGLREG
jgi:tetratricopeptide (TPR) repeat protein